MKELTKAEEQVMQHLWDLQKAVLKDVVEAFPEPKPAYTTVSTVIRVLVRKGFIGFEKYGKTNLYFPLVTKSVYSKATFGNIFKKYFNNSPTMFTSFFTKNEKFTLEELEEMKEIIEAQIKNKEQS